MPNEENNPLSARRTRFAREYIVHGNGTRAAIAAGYKPACAAQQASRLLRNVKVRAEIEAEKAKIHGKLDLSAERVLQEIARLAFFDMGSLYNEDGSMKRFHELDRDTSAAIRQYQVKTVSRRVPGENTERITESVKVRFADKGKSLAMLARHLKLFSQRRDVAGLDTLAEDIRKARLRVHSA